MTEQHPWWAGRMWACEPSKLESLLRFDGTRSEAEEPTTFALDGDKATIAIKGPLEATESFFGFLFGATSLESIATAVRDADADPRVASIVLDVDSPGGDVTGTQAAAEAVRLAQKPVVAFVGGDCCSAAFWIASAADTIVAAETARVGSIGCMATVFTRGSRFSKTFISSQSPLKNADPETDAGAAAFQTRVDDLAAVFLADVARNRGVTVEDAQERFGAGDVFVGARALRAGMVDALATTIQQATTHPAPRRNTEDGSMASEPITAPTPDETGITAELAEARERITKLEAELLAAQQPAPEEAALSDAAASGDVSKTIVLAEASGNPALVLLAGRVTAIEEAARVDRRENALNLAVERGLPPARRAAFSELFDANEGLFGTFLAAEKTVPLGRLSHSESPPEPERTEADVAKAFAEGRKNGHSAMQTFKMLEGGTN